MNYEVTFAATKNFDSLEEQAKHLGIVFTDFARLGETPQGRTFKVVKVGCKYKKDEKKLEEFAKNNS